MMLAVAAGCSSSHKSATARELATVPAGRGRLSGHLGPGDPPHSRIPPLTLKFIKADAAVTTEVVNGRFQVDLPAGVWEVHSSDGNSCATGLTVHAGALQSTDLVYPLNGCQNLSPP